MKRYIQFIPVSAVLALTVAGAAAQSTAPINPASAPATLGTTPQDAAEANQKAVPRSDTGTVVRTAPSPATRASEALSGSTTGGPSSTTGPATTMDTGTTTTTAPDAAPTTRGARADRN